MSDQTLTNKEQVLEAVIVVTVAYFTIVVASKAVHKVRKHRHNKAVDKKVAEMVKKLDELETTLINLKKGES